MDELTETFLTTWDDAWRFPEIWAQWCRKGLVDLDEAVCAVIAARLTPYDALGIWSQLLAQGEFQAAEELLEVAAFLAEAASGGADASRLVSELQRERRNALHELTLRAELATARAERLEVTLEVEPMVQQALRAAALYSQGAREQLERIEHDLSQVADERLHELEFLLDDRHGAGALTLPSSLNESIVRCLAAGEFRVAAALLTDNAVESSPAHLQLLRRPGTWPYRHERPQVVLDWFRRRGWAPLGFGERWAPPRLDVGWNLLEELAVLLTERANATLQSVGQVARTLTRYFGGPDIASAPAERRGGFLWSVVRGAGSWWLPALASRYGDDLILAMPDPMAEGEPRTEEIGAMVVLLDPWDDLWPVPQGALRLPIELILQSMPEPASRKAFLMRELGAQIPLLLLLPDQSPLESGILGGQTEAETLSRRFFLEECHSMVRTSLQTTRDLINVFLEISGVEVEHSEDLDLLAFYSGARPRLVGNILRRLFELLAKSRRGRRRAVSRRLVEEVWHDAIFRESALTLLLPATPRESLLLGALVYEVYTDRANSRSKPASLNALADTAGLWRQEALDTEWTTAGLSYLLELGLIEGSQERGFVLDPTGVGILVSESLTVNIDAYMERAAGSYAGPATPQSSGSTQPSSSVVNG